jgi:flagellar biosynthesis protein FlhF
MKVKRLFFESVKEGIKRIKSEYGPDAIIIDIKEKADSARKGYEILIAIDEEVTPQEAPVSEVMKRIEEINSSVKSLSERMGSVESDTMKYRVDAFPPTLRSFYEKMLKNGLDSKLAFTLVSEVFAETGKFTEDPGKVTYHLKRVLAKKIKVSPIDSSNEPILVLGPSGAGKTETTKKLAKRFMDAGVPVSIIAYEPQRRERYNELMIFSEHTGVPFYFTVNDEDLPFIVERETRKKIIDVTGNESLQKKAIDRLRGSKKLLLFPAWIRSEKIRDYCGQFNGAGAAGLIFTKLDEEKRHAHVIGDLVALEKPVCFLTTGMGIKDIVLPDQETFYNLVLEENVWRHEEKGP